MWLRNDGRQFHARVYSDRRARRGNGGASLAVPFALVRPARNALMHPDSTTAEWLSIIHTDWLKPGQTAFDLTATHASLHDAMLRIEGVAAMHGWSVIPWDQQPTTR